MAAALFSDAAAQIPDLRLAFAALVDAVFERLDVLEFLLLQRTQFLDLGVEDVNLLGARAEDVFVGCQGCREHARYR